MPLPQNDGSLARLRRFVALAGLTIASGAGLLSCEKTSSCHPTDYELCSCEGQSGYRRCGADGRFGSCDCSTTPGSDAGPPGSSAGGSKDGGSLLPFMAACTDNAECGTGLCFPFNAKGPHCSMPCDSPSECPPPSDGCSKMGVCKAP